MNQNVNIDEIIEAYMKTAALAGRLAREVIALRGQTQPSTEEPTFRNDGDIAGFLVSNTASGTIFYFDPENAKSAAGLTGEIRAVWTEETITALQIRISTLEHQLEEARSNDRTAMHYLGRIRKALNGDPGMTIAGFVEQIERQAEPQ